MFSYYSLIVSFLNKFLQVNSMKSVMYLFEDLVREICGPASIKILKLLEGKENVSEFVLAENLDMNINELRTYLYKLSENNLIPCMPEVKCPVINIPPLLLVLLSY